MSARSFDHRLTFTLYAIIALAAFGCGSDTASNANGDGGNANGNDAGIANDGGAASDGSVARDGASDGGAARCGDPESYMPAWATSFVPDKEIYVAPTGDDANDGTAQKPLKSTAAALTKLAPGVRLNFKPGTYACNVNIFGFAGTTAKPGMIRAVDGPRTAKFTCGTGDSGVYLSKSSGIILEGIELSGGGGHGIQWDSGSPFDPNALSHDLVVHKCFVHDSGYASIKVGQAKSIWVIGNEFAKPGVVSGTPRQNVELVVVDDSVVVGNESHDSFLFNEVKGGARRALIALNRIHDNTNGILVGGDNTGSQFLVDTTVDFEAKDVVVWGNTITLPGAGSEAFRIVACHDCLVANNTYYSPSSKTALRVLASAFTGGPQPDKTTHNKNLRVVNNVFASTTKNGVYMIASSGGEDAAALTLSHNAWFTGADDVTTVGSDIPFTGEAASLYNVDPQLANPPTDVSPKSGSPLLGKGMSLPEVPVSASGKCWTGAPNIGAF